MATDATGTVIGDYRDREGALRWDGRRLQLRPQRTLSWLPLVTSGRYVLADRERILAVLEGKPAFHRPLNIEMDDATALEPGLLLFVAFLGGDLAARDGNNDGA